jgi:hypothetical protein
MPEEPDSPLLHPTDAAVFLAVLWRLIHDGPKMNQPQEVDQQTVELGADFVRAVEGNLGLDALTTGRFEERLAQLGISQAEEGSGAAPREEITSEGWTTIKVCIQLPAPARVGGYRCFVFKVKENPQPPRGDR